MVECYSFTNFNCTAVVTLMRERVARKESCIWVEGSGSGGPSAAQPCSKLTRGTEPSSAAESQHHTYLSNTNIKSCDSKSARGRSRSRLCRRQLLPACVCIAGATGRLSCQFKHPRATTAANQISASWLTRS